MVKLKWFKRKRKIAKKVKERTKEEQIEHNLLQIFIISSVILCSGLCCLATGVYVEIPAFFYAILGLSEIINSAFFLDFYDKHPNKMRFLIILNGTLGSTCLGIALLLSVK